MNGIIAYSKVGIDPLSETYCNYNLNNKITSMPKKFKLKVEIDLIDGEYVLAKVSRSTTILALKRKLEVESGVPSQLLQLYYLDECALLDDDAVSNYHVLPDATLSARVFWPWANLIMAVKRNCLPDTMRSLAAVAAACGCPAPHEPRLDLERVGAALYYACHLGLTEMVEKLLELGVDRRRKLPSGGDAIEVAVRRGHMRCAELLLDRKVRQYEWSYEREHLTNWPLQDRVRANMLRISKIADGASSQQEQRVTESWKFDSSLSTWFRGPYQQMYLCNILGIE